MIKIAVLLLIIFFPSCKNLDSIFGDKKTGEKIYQSDVMIKIDYELSGQEIVLEDSKALSGNTSTHLPDLQMKTNHLIDGSLFRIKKFSEGIANTQLAHERKVYVNFSPIILSNLIITIADNNIIYAFDLSGKRTWSLNLNRIFLKKNQFANYISVVKGNQMIVHTSNGEIALFSLNDNITKKPALKWQIDISAKINSSIVFDERDSVFYITTIGSSLYEIDLNGNKNLKFESGKEAPPIYSHKSAAVFADSENIIFGDQNGELFCIEKKSNNLKWSINLNLLKQDNSESLRSGFGVNFVEHEDDIIVSSELLITASFNKKTGQLKWIKDIGIASEIAKNGDFIFFLDANNILIAMRASDGKVKWAQAMDFQKINKIPRYLNNGNYKYFKIIYHAPVLAEDEIILSNYFGELYRISPSTGNILSQEVIPYFIQSALTFANGTGYAANFTGELFKTISTDDK